MAQGDENFDCSFRFLSHEANSRLLALRAQYEVRLIETRHAIERNGWAMTESGRVISHAAQIRLVDVLIEMVEVLYEAAATGYFSPVGSSEYKERVDLVEQQLMDYAMERWRQLTRGLPLDRVGFDAAAGVDLGSDEVLLSDTLATHLRSKALELELQMWQTEVAAQSGEFARRLATITESPKRELATDINSQPQPDDSDSSAPVDRTEATIPDAEQPAGLAPVNTLDSRPEPLPDDVAHAQFRESTPTTERKVSGQAARTKPTDRNRTEAERRALVLGTDGLPTGKPPEGTFASNPNIQKLVEEHPEFSSLVNQVTQVDRARAEAEVAFRERELAEQWGTWSGVHPWDDKPDLETTDCPWWLAGAEYVFRIAFEWRTHSPSTLDRTEAALSKQVRLTATWVYWNRLFVHDGVHATNPKAENFLSQRNAERFADFAFLFCLRKFAEKDLDEWRKRAALLTEAVDESGLNKAAPAQPLVAELALESKASLADGPGRGCGRKVYKSVLGRNIDTLRKECGWAFGDLATATDLDKSLILGHVNKGKGANPATLKTYATAFSDKLGRTVTVAELEGEPTE